jgi:hypothetical protein
MIMPDTSLGRFAVEGYAKYLGVPIEDFVNGMKGAQTPDDVANAVIELLSYPTERAGSIFTVSNEGIAAVP